MTSSTNHSNHSTLGPTPSTPAPNFSFKALHSSKLQCSPRPTLPTSSRRHRSQVRALALPCPPFRVCLKLLAPSRRPKPASKSPREVDPPNSSNSSTGTPEVPKARNGRAWKWRSAAACGRWAVPCRHRTHPQALIRGPNDWRAICSSSQSGMSLPSGPPLLPSQSHSSKRAAAIFPYEPPSARPCVITHRRRPLRHARPGRRTP